MFPSKVLNIQNSILWKLPDLIEESYDCRTILELYEKTKKMFTDINEFLLSIDILYLFNIVVIDEEKGTIEYVKRNNM